MQVTQHTRVDRHPLLIQLTINRLSILEKNPFSRFLANYFDSLNLCFEHVDLLSQMSLHNYIQDAILEIESVYY